MAYTIQNDIKRKYYSSIKFLSLSNNLIRLAIEIKNKNKLKTKTKNKN